MELDYVSGSELHDEDWDDVDEVRGDRRFYNCGMMGHWMMGHFARDCKNERHESDQRQRQDGERRFRQVRAFQGRTCGTTARLRTSRTVLNMWQDRTQVVGMSVV